MIKQILLGVLFTGIAGGLIFGAVNRTLVKQESELRIAEGGGYGKSQLERPTQQPGDPPAETPRLQYEQQLRSGYAAGRQDGAAYGSPQSQAVTAEWITVEGQALSIDAAGLVVTAADGTEIEIDGRAWRLAQEEGFTAKPGDLIQLTGFYDSNSIFETSILVNSSSGQTITLRDESGRPRWAGRGRRG